MLARSILHKGPKSQLHEVHQRYFLNKIKGAKAEVWIHEINQRADVYLPKERIIFEIQISKITSIEIQRRTSSYESIGFQVIWIFPFPLFTHVQFPVKFYFSTINAEGIGEIIEVYDDKRFIVDISKPLPLLEEKRGFYFKGDLTDRSIRGDGQPKEKKGLGFYKTFIHKWFQKTIQ